MKKRIYSREFYKAVINNLSQEVDTQTMINAVSMATLLLPKERLYEEVEVPDGDSKTRFEEVDRLIQRLPKRSKLAGNEDLVPLADTTVSTPLYDLADLAKKARVNALAARAWLLAQGISPTGYGNNQTGELVAGYDKSILDKLMRHAWEISNGKNGAND